MLHIEICLLSFFLLNVLTDFGEREGAENTDLLLPVHGLVLLCALKGAPTCRLRLWGQLTSRAAGQGALFAILSHQRGAPGAPGARARQVREPGRGLRGPRGVQKPTPGASPTRVPRGKIVRQTRLDKHSSPTSR